MFCLNEFPRAGQANEMQPYLGAHIWLSGFHGCEKPYLKVTSLSLPHKDDDSTYLVSTRIKCESTLLSTAGEPLPISILVLSLSI